MRVLGVHHVALRTGDLQATTAFYETVLGLRAGPRPALGFAGAWLYAGDHPILHLYDAGGAGDLASGSGLIDHVALSAEGYEGFRARLAAMNVPFQANDRSDRPNPQIFIQDPNGVRIELNFDRGREAAIGL